MCRPIEEVGIAKSDMVHTLRYLCANILQRCSGASYALGHFTGDNPPQTALELIRPFLDKDVDAARAAAADLGLDLGLMAVATAGYKAS